MTVTTSDNAPTSSLTRPRSSRPLALRTLCVCSAVRKPLNSIVMEYVPGGTA